MWPVVVFTAHHASLLTCVKLAKRVARIMQTNRIKADTRVQVTALGQWTSIHPLAQQAEPAIYGGCTGSGMGDRHHVHSHLAGMALPGRGHGLACTKDRRMVNEAHHRPRNRSGCVDDGRLEARPTQSVLVHSDQGSQYGSDDWKRFCDANNLEPSMSRRGNCWDNAVAESCFSSLKKERIRKRIYKTRDPSRCGCL